MPSTIIIVMNQKTFSSRGWGTSGHDYYNAPKNVWSPWAGRGFSGPGVVFVRGAVSSIIEYCLPIVCLKYIAAMSKSAGRGDTEVIREFTSNHSDHGKASGSSTKVNGGNSGHVGNSGQRQFLQQIGRRRHLRRSRKAACGGGEAFPPAGASAAADSLQELSLSGVTHVSGIPPIYY